MRDNPADVRSQLAVSVCGNEGLRKLMSQGAVLRYDFSEYQSNTPIASERYTASDCMYGCINGRERRTRRIPPGRTQPLSCRRICGSPLPATAAASSRVSNAVRGTLRNRAQAASTLAQLARLANCMPNSSNVPPRLR